MVKYQQKLVQELMTKNRVKHKQSTPYHPQANGKVEVTNKELERILTKNIQLHRKYWDSRLMEAIWFYNTTHKTTTGLTPYEFLFGKKAMIPIEFEHKTMRMISQLDLDITKAQKEILHQLNQLDELRQEALIHTELIQRQRKGWHDKFIKINLFKEGYWTLLYDSRYKYFKGKLITK